VFYPGAKILNNDEYFCLDFSHIRFSLDCHQDGSLTSPNNCGNSTVDLLAFEEPRQGRSWESYWPSETFCCTTQLIEKKKYNSFTLTVFISFPD